MCLIWFVTVRGRVWGRRYGLAGLAAVSASAAAAGIAVVTALTFAGDTLAGLNSSLAQLAAAAVRYVILWCFEPVCSGALGAARGAGLVGPKFVWVVSAEPQFAGLRAAVAAGAFDGLLAVVPTRVQSDSFGQELYGSVLSTWARSFPGTYPTAVPVDPFVGYAVDAVRAVQAAAVAAVAGGWAPNTNTTPNVSSADASCFASHAGAALPLKWLRGVLVAGITGNVQFSDGSCERRTASIAIENFRAVPGGSGSRGFEGVASYDAGTVMPPSPVIVWASGSTTPPPDRDVLRGRVLNTITIPTDPFVRAAPDGALSGLILELAGLVEAATGVIFKFRLDPVVTTFSGAVNAVAAGQYVARAAIFVSCMG